MFSFSGEIIAELCEFERRRRFAPVCGKSTDFDLFSAYLFGNFCAGQDEIGWGFVLVEMDEILQHRQ